jgi:hypothetical protein
VLTGRFVEVVATFRAKAPAVRPTDRLQRQIQEQVFTDQGVEVQDAGLRDAEKRIRRFPGRIHKQVVEADIQPLREILQAANTIHVRLSLETPLGV